MPRTLCCALLVALAVGGLGCVLVGPPPPIPVMPDPELSLGPPPRAPAWGARRENREGRDAAEAALRFEPALGVDVVVGRPGVYFDDGLFFRFSSGFWQASVALDGPWRPRDERRVPPGLRARYRRSRAGHRRGHQRREERGAAHPDWDE